MTPLHIRHQPHRMEKPLVGIVFVLGAIIAVTVFSPLFTYLQWRASGLTPTEFIDERFEETPSITVLVELDGQLLGADDLVTLSPGSVAKAAFRVEGMEAHDVSEIQFTLDDQPVDTGTPLQFKHPRREPHVLMAKGRSDVRSAQFRDRCFIIVAERTAVPAPSPSSVSNR